MTHCLAQQLRKFLVVNTVMSLRLAYRKGGGSSCICRCSLCVLQDLGSSQSLNVLEDFVHKVCYKKIALVSISFRFYKHGSGCCEADYADYDTLPTFLVM